MITMLGTPKEGQVVGSLLENILTEEYSELTGEYYRGFPILVTSEGGLTLDAIMCSPEHGVVIFHFHEEPSITDDFVHLVDEVHMHVKAKLSEVHELRKGRDLSVPLSSIVFCPNIPTDCYSEYDEHLLLSRNSAELIQNLKREIWINPELQGAVLSRLQSLTSVKPRKKRSYVKSDNSKGGVLKNLERSLATLDTNQSKAVLEEVNGVQRIRGLAGSGKTVVLARKIAHIHAQNPQWNIAVTFNTRSLKVQLKRLISIFYYDSMGENPDWDKVNIVQAWGGQRAKGYTITPASFIIFHITIMALPLFCLVWIDLKLYVRVL